jgi:phospholipid transport system substrate-binding protein
MPRTSLKRRRVLLLPGVTLLAALASRARGQSDGTNPAAKRIRAFYDALLDVMKQADRLGIDGRYQKLAPVIGATFDLAAMTRIAVGPDWSALSAAQQDELVASFSRMTIATYANRFDGYSGERFEVEPTTEERSTGRVVHTKLIPSNGDAVTLNYLMRGSGENWKIVDVYLTGTISELATRRAEFSSILKSGGAPGLIESLHRQADRQMHGTKTDAGKH